MSDNTKLPSKILDDINNGHRRYTPKDFAKEFMVPAVALTGGVFVVILCFSSPIVAPVSLGAILGGYSACEKKNGRVVIPKKEKFFRRILLGAASSLCFVYSARSAMNCMVPYTPVIKYERKFNQNPPRYISSDPDCFSFTDRHGLRRRFVYQPSTPMPL